MNKSKNNSFLFGLISGCLIVCIISFALSHIATGIHGQEYNELELVDLDNKPVNLSQFTGKPLVVDYWATWCRPCIEQFPLYELASKHYNGQVVFIMIADDSLKKIRKTVGKNPKLKFYVSKKMLKLSVRPITLFYNKKHELVEKHIGTLEKSSFYQLIEKIKQN